jgi:hypothetical protein
MGHLELADLVRDSGLSTQDFAKRLEMSVRSSQQQLSGDSPARLITVLAARWLVRHEL